MLFGKVIQDINNKYIFKIVYSYSMPKVILISDIVYVVKMVFIKSLFYCHC